MPNSTMVGTSIGQWCDLFPAKRLLLVVVVLLTTTALSKADFSIPFTQSDLMQLQLAEADMVDLLQMYVVEQENKAAEIQRYIDDIKAKQEYEKRGGEHQLFYVGHPVNAFNLIKRWYRMSQLASASPTYEDIYNEIAQLPVPVLTWLSCVEMGNAALEKQQAPAAIYWYQQAIHLMEDAKQGVAAIKEIYGKLKTAYEIVGNKIKVAEIEEQLRGM